MKIQFLVLLLLLTVKQVLGIGIEGMGVKNDLISSARLLIGDFDTTQTIVISCQNSNNNWVYDIVNIDNFNLIQQYQGLSKLTNDDFIYKAAKILDTQDVEDYPFFLQCGMINWNIQYVKYNAIDVYVKIFDQKNLVTNADQSNYTDVFLPINYTWMNVEGLEQPYYKFEQNNNYGFLSTSDSYPINANMEGNYYYDNTKGTFKQLTTGETGDNTFDVYINGFLAYPQKCHQTCQYCTGYYECQKKIYLRG